MFFLEFLVFLKKRLDVFTYIAFFLKSILKDALAVSHLTWEMKKSLKSKKKVFLW